MKGLVIEQEKLYRAILIKLLADLGYEVIAPSSKNEILEAIAQTHFDLVLLGMSLSDMTGTSFCEALRRQEKNCNTPVFLITSSEDAQLLDSVIASGVTEIFQKDQINILAEYLHINRCKSIRGMN